MPDRNFTLRLAVMIHLEIQELLAGAVVCWILHSARRIVRGRAPIEFRFSLVKNPRILLQIARRRPRAVHCVSAARVRGCRETPPSRSTASLATRIASEKLLQ